jgi:hypothetical protein
MQDYRLFITSNPNILFGKPVIKDTRIAVEHILDELAGGTTIEQLLKSLLKAVGTCTSLAVSAPPLSRSSTETVGSSVRRLLLSPRHMRIRPNAIMLRLSPISRQHRRLRSARRYKSIFEKLIS